RLAGQLLDDNDVVLGDSVLLAAGPDDCEHRSNPRTRGSWKHISGGPAEAETRRKTRHYSPPLPRVKRMAERAADTHPRAAGDTARLAGPHVTWVCPAADSTPG